MNKRIGVVGYSGQKFDEEEAKKLIEQGLDLFEADMNDELVSGLTDLGIPALAYRAAEDRKMRTVGIACDKAGDYDVYPCDRVMIEGKDWGDESPHFLGYITHMIKIGGGKQSEAEYNKFGGFKADFPLQAKE